MAKPKRDSKGRYKGGKRKTKKGGKPRSRTTKRKKGGKGVGHCTTCGKTVFGGAKGMNTHRKRNHKRRKKSGGGKKSRVGARKKGVGKKKKKGKKKGNVAALKRYRERKKAWGTTWEGIGAAMAAQQKLAAEEAEKRRKEAEVTKFRQQWGWRG